MLVMSCARDCWVRGDSLAYAGLFSSKSFTACRTSGLGMTAGSAFEFLGLAAAFIAVPVSGSRGRLFLSRGAVGETAADFELYRAKVQAHSRGLLRAGTHAQYRKIAR